MIWNKFESGSCLSKGPGWLEMSGMWNPSVILNEEPTSDSVTVYWWTNSDHTGWERCRIYRADFFMKQKWFWERRGCGHNTSVKRKISGGASEATNRSECLTQPSCGAPGARCGIVQSEYSPTGVRGWSVWSRDISITINDMVKRV